MQLLFACWENNVYKQLNYFSIRKLGPKCRGSMVCESPGINTSKVPVKPRDIYPGSFFLSTIKSPGNRLIAPHCGATWNVKAPGYATCKNSFSGQLLTSFTDDYDELDDLGVHSPTFNYQLDHTCLLIITSNYINFNHQILLSNNFIVQMFRFVMDGPLCPEIWAVRPVMSRDLGRYVPNLGRYVISMVRYVHGLLCP